MPGFGFFRFGSGLIVRIIGGSAGGRYISTPKGRDTRPTSSIVRESLFNVLSGSVSGAVALDLFSGSGAMGLEALSRGASIAIFVDNNKKCCDIIKHNVELLGFTDKALIIKCDVLEAGQWGRGIAKKYGEELVDLVIADPPYDFAKVADLPGIIAQSSVVSIGALLVFEHGGHTKMPGEAGPFHKCKERLYGGTAISVYENASGRVAEN